MAEMKTHTLKELKEALNKLPDNLLDKFFISDCLWCEEPSPEFAVTTDITDDKEWKVARKLFNYNEFDVISEFVEQLNCDLEKIAISRISPELSYVFSENYPIRSSDIGVEITPLDTDEDAEVEQ